MEEAEERYETVIALAVSQSKSVRTTIPKYIARKLGLKPGVRVVWDLDKTGNKWVATIEKKE